MNDDLKERVNQFNSLSLPGHPIFMHMGTSYLVNDLWMEIERLRQIPKVNVRCQTTDGIGSTYIEPLRVDREDDNSLTVCINVPKEAVEALLRAMIRDQSIEIDRLRAEVEAWKKAGEQWDADEARYNELLDALRAEVEALRGHRKLWLWRNFVDGTYEYWAFDNPFPIHLDCGDPQTIGEPCGYALFKPSRQGRTDVPESEVLRRIKLAHLRDK